MTGFPVVSKAACPMAAKVMKMENGKKCEHCAKMTQDKQPDQGKCCSDKLCTIQCQASIGSNTGINHSVAVLMDSDGIATKFYSRNDMPSSYLLLAQDRPPKYLS